MTIYKMSARFHSAVDYLNHYRQLHQYDIVSTLSNSTFWIALGAIALLGYLRINAKLLRHFKKQSAKHQIWAQQKDLHNESIESSSFICSKHHRFNTYYGVINKIGMDSDGNAKWAWHIYTMHSGNHIKKELPSSIDGSDHEESSGPQVCKLACIKHIESKGYTIKYENEPGW